MKKLSRKKLKEKFNEFLRKENCASKFYANFYNPKAKRWRNVYEVRHRFEYAAIGHAFDWYHTPENYGYWANLSAKWVIKYKKLTQK
jgi:hypothetical protein